MKSSDQSNKMDAFSILSELIDNDKKIIDEFFNDENNLLIIVAKYQKSFIIPEIKEIAYFFTILINKCDVIQFNIIRKYNILKNKIVHAKSIDKNDQEIIIFLQLIQIILDYGKDIILLNEVNEENNNQNLEAIEFIKNGGNQLKKLLH